MSEAQSALATHRAEAQRLADIWLQDLWVGRDTAAFSVRPGLVDLQPGDIVRLGAAGGGRLFQIQRIVDGAAREISARAVDPAVYDTAAPRIIPVGVNTPKFLGPPRVVALDLAIARDTQALSYVAAFADPWPGPLSIVKIGAGGGETIGLIEKRATIGDTLDVLPAGPVGRFDLGSSVRVRLAAGQLASVDDLTALGGKTTMAIRGADGCWEIFGFACAELVDDRTYRLSRLIRGLGGEEALAIRAAPAGSTVVLLDDAVLPLASDASEIDAPIVYAVGPSDRSYADPLYTRITTTATKKALMPYAPTQPQARRTADGVVISFLRRSRIDADAWSPIDVPLGETREAYEGDIALPSGVRTLAAATPALLYPAAQEIADFGAPQSALSLSLFQLSGAVGRGFAYAATLPVR